MDARMATPAQSHQIIQGVVSKLARRSRAVFINVMNAKVVSRSAVTTSESISLNGFGSVPAKGIIVFGLLDVLSMKVGVFSKPFAYFCNAFCALAFFASSLRARAVNKIISAIQALLNRVDGCCALLCTKVSKVYNICLGSKNWAALSARFLRRGRWQIDFLAFNAGFVFVRHGRSQQTVFAS